MADLVPVCVTLRRGRRDKNDSPTVWPDYSSLNGTLTDNLPLHEYIMQFAGGWEIDDVENVGLENRDYGEAMTLVPDALAQAMIALHPTETRLCTEAEYETFWDTRARVNQAEIFDEREVLQAIAAKIEIHRAQKAGVPWVPDPDDIRALDPDQDRIPGRQRNIDKTWAQAKPRRLRSPHRIRPDLAKP